VGFRDGLDVLEERQNIRSRSPDPPARSLVTTPTAEQVYVIQCQEVFLNTAVLTA